MPASKRSRISTLPEHVREQVRRRLAGGAAPSDVIPAAPRGGPLPLSFPQQRLWFLNELQPDAAGYHSALILRLSGELDVPALTAALRELVSRHEALRTTFDDVDGTGVQITHPALDLAVPVVDCPRETLDDRLLAEYSRPFDLRRGPVFRALLLRLGDHEHVLSLTAHHIVIDGWSMGVLTDELSVLYDAARRGEPGTLPPLPIQYADFAVWQRNRLSAQAMDEHLDYWRRQLSGLAPLELSTDRPRPPIRTSAGAVHEFAVPADVGARLRDLAREEGTTLFTALVAACQVLLARHAGQDDVAVGTAVAGRDRPELSPLVGFFVNTVVLRSTVDNERTFREFLTVVKDTVLAAFDHGEVPFDRLVESLRTQRDASRNPLFDVMVVLQNAPRKPPRQSGLRMANVELSRRVANFDITLEVEERDDAGLAVALEYNTDLFDASTIQRMATHLVTLLRELTGAPDRPMARLSMLTDAERHQVLVAWNGSADSTVAATLPDLFEAQAARTPDATAVTCDGTSLSYVELEARADRLAHRLAEAGASPERFVALALPRSVDLVVAILAVLKTGAAYVPLDPDHPAERIAGILRDCDPVVLVTEGDTEAALHPATPVDRAGLAPAGAAYVIYTSGSTGAPKGVVVPHANVVRLLTATREWFDFDETDVWTLFHSYAFDFSVWEMWGALLHGGRLVVVPGAVARSPEEFLRLLVAERVTVLNQTPSAFYQLMAADRDDPDLGARLRLRHVVFGGEALDPRRLADWHARHPDEAPVLTNMYGITETTVHVTRVAIDADVTGSVIGTAIPDLRVYVLDSSAHPVPPGVPGELHIAGAGLARGYLNHPGLTAARFVANPFGKPGTRMYRTGDLARWNASTSQNEPASEVSSDQSRRRRGFELCSVAGQLVYLGRADHQVKIRGFRIEPGEIETALLNHPDVAETAVIARDDGGTGHKRLVAYVVPAGAGRPDAAELRDALRRRLPDYMLPSAFVLLDDLPLTPNGKLDRAALPAPDGQTPRESAHVPPRTQTERTLARVWSDVLGAGRVGAEDDFFGLGGDSILAIQMVSRARQAGLRLTARDVFQHPTIAQLAAVVGARVVADPVEHGPLTGPAPLSPIQHWFFAHYGELPQYTMSTLLDLVEDIDEDMLRAAFAAVVAHHDALRTRFQHIDGQWCQEVVASDPPAAGQVIDLSDVDEPGRQAAVEATALAAQTSLDLSAGQLIRYLLFTGGARPRLFITAHHLVMDGVSWRILLGDLETAYRQLRAGEPVRLEPVATSATRWAHRLTEHVRSGGLDTDLGHWAAVLKPAEPELAGPHLPVDHPGSNTAGTAQVLSVRLGRADTDALLHHVPARYRTRVDDVLLSALGRVLATWTGRDRVLITMEGHGREEEILDGVDLSRTIGWFTSQYPVVLTMPSTSDWGRTLKSVKEQLRAVPRRGLSYGGLRYLTDSNELTGDLAPGISFNYHGQWDVATSEESIYRDRCAGIGRDHAPDSVRPQLLDVVGVVEHGELALSWHYAGEVHDESTVRRLADEVVGALREIVAHCARPEAGGCTPSDFPLARLGQAAVDRIAGDGRSVEDVYPLTPLQAGMLFHSLVDDGTTAYFDQFRLRVSGVRDPLVFATAWQRVVDRMPVLRSRVVWQDVPEPLQVVHRRVPVPIAHHDWRGLTATDRDLKLRRLLDDDRAAGMDLATPGLTRLAIARVADDEVLLVWTTHHVLLDGWSTAQVFSEVCEQYAAIVTNSPAELVSRRPFRDYLRWLHEQDHEAAEEHWRRVLAGFVAPSPLPFDRPPVEAHRAESRDSVSAELSADESHRLRQLAQRNGLTASTIVQGAWALLLSRFSGEQDVVFGTTVSGRPAELPGVESMVGMFINTVPARVRVHSGHNVLSWLRQLQAEQVESRRFEFVSLAQLRSWSDLPAGANLFDSVVVFENYPLADAEAPGGLRLTDVQALDTTNFPLALSAYLTDRLGLELGYDPRLFDPATARRLVDVLCVLLRAVLTEPDQPLARLPWLSADEHQRIVVEWNDTVVRRPARRCVHELFEEQVRRVPDAVAVIHEGTSLTFAELDARANKLAHHLIGLGAGRGQVVALALPRSSDVVLGILAVLKAGAAYVPMDPGLPSDRLAFMLTDSGARWLLTHRHLVDTLPDTGALPVVLDVLDVLDERAAGTSRPLATAPTPEVGPHDLAYIAYTSGSTGTPKGVMIEHRQLDYIATAWDERYELSRRPLRFVCVTGLAVDLFTADLLRSTFFGGVLIIAPTDVVTDPPRLLELIDDVEGSAIELVPPLAAALVREAARQGRSLPPLALMSVGSEGWRVGDCAELLNLVDPETLAVNVYGATEVTVDSCVCVPSQELLRGRAVVPLGRPLANTRVYILDANLNPVPVGVPGEICIGGGGVGRGYANRPGLTADRFVADPFGPPGSRMYRTGDRASYLSDGTLDFGGRVDMQVKIRGFRVEPGEIEQVLLTHPDVAEAVVVARDESGHQRLVGYVVPTGPATPTVPELRAWLSRSVPDYMVPSAFVTLDALPLTPNKKLDRRALPAPDWSQPRGADYLEPRTEVERVTAEIWAEVLGVPRVGVLDNFFELGGDSILSIRVVSRLRTAFGVELSPRELFDTPTVDGLAATIAAGTGPEHAPAPIPLRSRDEPLPLSFAQQRLWFLDQFEPGGTEYLTPQALRLRGHLDLAALDRALTALVARHESLRTTFDTVDGNPVQIVHPPAEQHIPLLDLTRLSERDRETRLTEALRNEARTPFDLREGPLVRARLLRLAADEHVLTLMMHHIITDGVSGGVIAAELSTLFGAALTGAEPELPELSLQYADFAAWQREQLTEHVLDEQLTFWRRQLDGVPRVELPIDRPRPAVRTTNGALVEFLVPDGVTRRLVELGRQRDGTLFITLVAACQVLLSRWSGQHDLALGTVTSGRERLELENLVGFFVNTVVLRSTVDDGRSFREFLAGVRDTVLDAFAHQDVPFERVVDDLRPARDTSRTPLFDVLLVLQNVPEQTPQLPGLEVEELPVPVVAADFDLTIQFTELAGGLHCALNYNTELFTAGTVERLATHIQTLLDGIAADPDRTIARLPLLPADERGRVLVEWNDTARTEPVATFTEMFEAQVARTPAATAVVCGEVVLTFAELNARANRLARRLVSLGAGAETVVALILPRSQEMVVAILAVLKAGAAYLPIDPEYPAERIEFMLRDANPVLVLDKVVPDPEAQPDGDLTDAERHRPLRTNNAAYVIYTSGSTGRPKGVVVEHGNLANLVKDHHDLVSDESRLRVSTTAVFSFDASWDGLALLAAGHELHIVDDDTRLDPRAMVDYLAEHRVDVLSCTPSYLKQLLPAGLLTTDRHRPARLLVGGEAIDPALWRELAAADDVECHNTYGPTECTVDAVRCQVAGHDRPVIGRPGHDLQAFVLDGNLEPVPIGVPGELYLAGAQTARGYLNRPGLTARLFVANPFGPPGSRMYRTGDVVRWTAEGVLEYRGRLDDQVKIRGFRIEPGEIEAALVRHEEVAEAVVVAREDEPHPPRLVAYVRPAGSANPGELALRTWLKTCLPDYLVPSVFVLLNEMPVSASGKIDRKALPVPDADRELETEYVPPRTQAESVLAQIWSAALGVTRVGIHDNFFGLGGDSILSIQVVSRARQAGVRITPKELFLHQTIAELGAVAGARTASDRARRAPIAGPAPLTPIQRWFLDEQVAAGADPHHFTMSMDLDLAADLDEDALGWALAALSTHHEALRTRFEKVDGGWVAHVHPEQSTVDYQVHDLSRLDERTALDNVLAAAHAGLHLTQGPLIRFLLCTFGPGRAARLVAIAHHLVVDGVSWRILLGDLETAYHQARAGEPIRLEPVDLPFGQWAHRLVEHVRRGGFSDDVEYWSSRPGYADADLPVDRSGTNTAASTRTVSATLSRTETDALLHRVPDVYRTQINDVLLSALGATLSAWAGQPGALIAVEGHGREDVLDDVDAADLSRTVGWFTAQFPVALEFPDTTHWGAILKSVKEQLRAVPHRGLSYEALRYLSADGSPTAALRAQRPPQISFNYHGRFDVATGDGLYRGSRSGSVLETPLDSPRPHLLEVVGGIANGELRLSWEYSANVHDETTVRRLAEGTVAALRDIVEHCVSAGAGGRTPSDFPLARLSQPEVDRLAGDGRSIEDLYPLTSLQAGMLFHNLVDAGSGAYLNQVRLRLSGVTEPDALRVAWQRVVDRTPVLRSSVVWEGVEQPAQLVHRHVVVPTTHHDLHQLSGAAAEEALRAILADDRAAGMDLTVAPLMRLVLVRLPDDDVELVWTTHHLVLDGWSTAQVVAETFKEYSAIVAGRPAGTDAVPRRPFRDYLRWLADQDLGQAEEHWRGVLTGFGSPTPLPYDRSPREAHRAESSGAVPIELPVELSRRLRGLARRNGLTLNTIVQGAWALLLSWYSGERDVVFGTTVSGRPAELPGVESMVGMFINTVPTRVRVHSGHNLLSWLGELQAEQTESRRFEFVSLAQLRSWSDLAAGANLFDSAVVFENYPIDGSSDAELGVSIRAVDATDSTTFPLLLSAYLADRLNLELAYDPRLFAAATVERLATHLEALLENISAHPDRPLAGLPALPEDERHRMLVEWNDTGIDVPAVPLTALFEDQARRTPGETALVCQDSALDFASVNTRANRLARLLVRRGAGPERVVALALPRDAELVVAMLAVLKAGAAYLPIDPDLPADRIAFLLDDARPVLVVTARGAEPARPGTEHLVLDAPETVAELASIPAGNLTDADRNGPLRMDNPAYLIYTSGSTGTPKGVLVEHRSLTNLYIDHSRELIVPSTATGERVRFALTVSFSFDMSWEGPLFLVAGHEVHVIDDEVRRDPDAFVDYVIRHRIDVVDLTPAYAQQLLAAGLLADPRHRPRRLTMGGEAAGEALWQELGAAPELTSYNIYGPTECTVDAVYGRITAGTRPVIGRPGRNVRAYVLDAEQHPVPVGIAGELCLGGDQVARGYVNRPGLTADRFVADPYGPPGSRMYRTGDRTRWTDQGVLEYLGRVDEQVKIRGFRVEPGEVESALLAHPEVAEAVVVAWEDGGHRRLVAYVVPAAAAAPSVPELRSWLLRSLPDYLVPSAFVTLDRIPLTSHGKVDRDTLPAPAGRPELESAYVAPRTRMEAELARVWAEVLGVPRVGVEDNFFELGGDSILSIKIISRLRATFDTDVSPRAVFTTPTVAGLAATIRTGATAAIPVVPRDRPLPLSFAQQRLWFLDQFEPDSAVYVSPFAMRLRGELDVAALGSALTALVARHESLRTTFEDIDGRGVQVIHPPAALTVPVTDHTGLSEQDSADALGEILAKECADGFDLRRGPLLRTRLVRLAPDEHVLTVMMHHIVTDGWSTGVLTGELSTLYGAAVRGIEPELPALPLQYADFAVWQRVALASGELDEQVNYWQRQLAGVRPLELPTDRPRPAVRTTNGAQLEFTVPAKVVDGLKAVAHRQHGTLFMTLIAASQILLARWSGQDDITLGTVTSGRERPELDRLVGFFVNTLVLRSAVREDQTYREFLTEVRATVLDAFAHQDVPFERVVDVLEPVRDTSRSPLFDVMVSLQNVPGDTADLAGLELSDVDLPVTAAAFDLTLEFQELADGGLQGAITYSTDLFEPATADRLATHLRVLLDAITADPDRPIARLVSLPDAELRQVLSEWNDTGRPLPEVTVPELVEAQVARTPDATAVVDHGRVLSYAQLDAWANRLAHKLIGLGAGPERCVAVSLPRSAELLVALLAAGKAGAAYVPLEPDHPAERRALILSDARPVAMLDTVDAVRSVDGYPDTTPDNDRVGPANAMYVIYTSGSTGRPKGVVVTHRSVANYLLWAKQAYPGLGGAAVLHSPVSFDLTVTTLFGPLVAGGRIRVAELTHTDVAPDAFLKATPSHLALLNALPTPLSGGDLPTGELVVGGEQLTGAVVEQWRRAHPGVPVVNEYGPTEATVGCVAYRVEPGAPGEEGPVPIGRPAWNTRLYVLDRLLRPVPVGAAGELFIAGSGLARGYVHQPGVTADRFLACPFGEPGERMYRTGDLVRWRPDGNMEYLGRTDDQVKVRGYRVEPGEIESALLRHEAVADAVVATWQAAGGHRRLVGYLVPTGPDEPGNAALREFLGRTLPDYLVPSAFVRLASLPLTPNGKLDRAALPDPESSVEPDAGHVPPRTSMERALARLWADVLGLERVGVSDNFFELGGDSILIIQVVARGRKAGLVLTTKDLFLHQTIASLAPVVTRLEAAATTSGPVVGPVPLTPIQHWFFQTQRANHHHYNQSVLVELPEDLEEPALERALEAVLSHHDALRMRFEYVDGQWRQDNAAIEPAGLPDRHDLSDVDPGEQAAAMEKIADGIQRGFDLGRGPLFNAALFVRGAGGRPCLFLVAHHLVIDGVSWRILLDDLESAYHQATGGAAIDLGAKGTSVRDWSRRLREYVAGGGLDSEVDHWAHVLEAGARQGGPRPRAAETPRVVPVELSAEDTETLLRTAPTIYRTGINDILLTALAWALSRWTGNSRVYLDLEGHGREDVLDDVDLSRTVGWFTTLFPVVLEVPGGADPDWRALVKSTRRQLRAIPRKGFGFGALRYLGSTDVRERLSGDTAQIAFNYLGQWDTRPAGEGPGLCRATLPSIGQEYDPADRDSYLLEIVGAAEGGRLQFAWYHHPDLPAESAAQAFGEALERIARQCRDAEADQP